jgi:hypothetical protein
MLTNPVCSMEKITTFTIQNWELKSKLRYGFRGFLHTLDPEIEIEKLRLNPWFFYIWFCCGAPKLPCVTVDTIGNNCFLDR